MSFESPLAFLLLLLIPLLFKKKKSQQGINFSSPVDISSLPHSFRAKAMSPILITLKSCSFILLVIALARPQTITSFIETEASGRDLILTMDVSGSMDALDFYLDGKRVSRLTALKSVVVDFIKGRTGDRMGLVVFGDTAYTQCPLTLDHDILTGFVERLEVGIAGQKTAIGDALAITLKRIKDIEADSKVIILLTDGKNNAGDLKPKETAELAKKLNVKIHTIGIGTNGYSPIPVKTKSGATIFQNVKFEIDEKSLKEISSISGGKYFKASNIKNLKEIYKEIDLLEERKEKTYEYFEYEEEYLRFLFLGLGFFLLHEILTATIFLKIP